MGVSLAVCPKVQDRRWLREAATELVVRRGRRQRPRLCVGSLCRLGVQLELEAPAHRELCLPLRAPGGLPPPE